MEGSRCPRETPVLRRCRGAPPTFKDSSSGKVTSLTASPRRSMPSLTEWAAGLAGRGAEQGPTLDTPRESTGGIGVEMARWAGRPAPPVVWTQSAARWSLGCCSELGRGGARGQDARTRRSEHQAPPAQTLAGCRHCAEESGGPEQPPTGGGQRLRARQVQADTLNTFGIVLD